MTVEQSLGFFKKNVSRMSFLPLITSVARNLLGFVNFIHKHEQLNFFNISNVNFKKKNAYLFFFSRSFYIQKQSLEVFLKKIYPYKFFKLHTKTSVLESLFLIKLQASSLIKLQA